MSVLVLGMHRSGTSAATRIISLMGLRTCAPNDMLPGNEGNSRGHWESGSLVRLNDRLLAQLDATWWCPPRQEDSLQRIATPQRVAAARRTFEQAHPEPSWVWKDPRNCILLPFWLHALPSPHPSIVLLLRHPLEICDSLARRNNFTIPMSLALWERYLRQAMANIKGLPVLVTTYDDLTTDPLGWSERVGTFLGASGTPVSEGWDRRAVAAFVSERLRHSVHSGSEVAADAQLSAEQRELAAVVEDVVGSHAAFSPPRLPPETATTAVLFDELRATYGLTHGGGAALNGAPSGITIFQPETTQRTTTRPVVSLIVVRDHRRTAMMSDLRAALPSEAQILFLDAPPHREESVPGLSDRRALGESEDGGVAQLMNRSAEAADGSVVIFCRTPVEIDAKSVERLIHALTVPETAAAGPALQQSGIDGRWWYGMTLDQTLRPTPIAENSTRRPFPVPVLSSSFLAVRREVFCDIGGFDTGMWTMSAADVELSMRLWRMGFSCHAVPAAKARPVEDTAPSEGARRRAEPLPGHDLHRLAVLHLTGTRLDHAMQAVDSQPPTAWSNLEARQANDRRAELRAMSRYDDTWFFKRFGIGTSS